ncbi:MAG: MoxR family ATPase [Candidatus Altiarchaeota archaeon]|nr:MoxR family ATPase [Candidatus Altiarchaeota archaeon]
MMKKYQSFMEGAGQVLVGYEEITKGLLVALLCKGHLLLEGPPGVAKTTLAKTFSQLVDAGFKRVQFTPDLLPTDIVGTMMFDPKKSEFRIRKGPIFTNIVLADEINRASPKTQSALLEAMEEKQVTIEGTTYPLDKPFIVLATQNPIEQEGTYPLPEAQLDRFLFKVSVHYPEKDDEKKIVKKVVDPPKGKVKVAFTKQDILKLREEVSKVYVSDNIVEYITAIVMELRKNPVVAWGPSPRASIALMSVGRAVAYLDERNFVTPTDVNKYAIWTLQHRIGIKPENEIEGVTTSGVVKDTLEKVDTL